PQFETASQLNPNFAAPHFQLSNAYRGAGRKEEAAREMELFNEVKKRKAGAAVAEDPEWSFYSEIYDVAALDSEFELEAASPAFKFKKAVLMNYDHDYDLDLLLLGEQSVLLRNDGSAGFSDQTSRFPFTAGRVTDAATFELVPDNNEIDLAVQYDDGRVVIYRDQLLGHYQAKVLPGAIQGGAGIQAFDLNNDGWADLIVASSTGVHLLMNDHGKLVESGEAVKDHGALVVADLA